MGEHLNESCLKLKQQQQQQRKEKKSERSAAEGRREIQSYFKRARRAVDEETHAELRNLKFKRFYVQVLYKYYRKPEEPYTSLSTVKRVIVLLFIL